MLGGGMAKKKLLYFFLNDELHKTLKINRPTDLITAWNYTQRKRQAYVWSDVRRNHGRAFSLTEVADMLGRHRVNIEMLIVEGKIRRPQRIYSLDGKFTPGKYFFQEKEVYALHDYLLTIHIGRPRRDGKVTPGRLPSKLELRAMMQHDTVLYVKTESGGYTPIWKEVDW